MKRGEELTLNRRLGLMSVHILLGVDRWNHAFGVPGHGYETALCAGYAAILTPVAAPVSRAFCSALI